VGVRCVRRVSLRRDRGPALHGARRGFFAAGDVRGGGRSLQFSLHVSLVYASMAMPHKPFSDSVEISVLTKCKRRCALCYGLNNDDGEKRGQLAHIDRNGENIEENNAAFLCLEHHELYDSTSRQAKGYKPGELKRHQETLLVYVLTLKNEPSASANGIRPTVGLDLYDRRLLIYKVARQFVRDVFEHLKPDLQLILKFVADTDEALFLFDPALAEYLETLFKQALRLHTVGLLRERMQTNVEEVEKFVALVQEHTGLAEWFSKQPEEIRARFAPFLRVA
jgi:hypothetical protein